MARDGVKVAVLWKKQDANGDDYFVGPFTSDTGIAVFPTKGKKEKNDPDAYLYLLPNRKNGKP